MSVDNDSSQCMSCGTSKVPIINASSLTLEEELKVRKGRAVFIRHRFIDNLPRAVCLNCQPDWLGVNDLRMEYDDWQIRKEKAIDSGDIRGAQENQRRPWPPVSLPGRELFFAWLAESESQLTAPGAGPTIRHR